MHLNFAGEDGIDFGGVSAHGGSVHGGGLHGAVVGAPLDPTSLITVVNFLYYGKKTPQ